jgi:hypothetical protein
MMTPSMVSAVRSLPVPRRERARRKTSPSLMPRSSRPGCAPAAPPLRPRPGHG